MASLDLTDNRRAHRELLRQTRELQAAYAISQAIVAASTPQPIWEAILRELPPVLEPRRLALEYDGQRMGASLLPTNELHVQRGNHAFHLLLDGPPLSQGERRLLDEVLRRVEQWLQDFDARQGLAAALQASRADEQAKSAFLAHMSHEIRTPLHALLGFTHLLAGDPRLDPEQRESVEVIGENGRRLLALLENVLTLSHLEGGRLREQLEDADLVRELRDIVALFQPRAREKGLTLALEEHPAALHARVDVGKLRQIVTNLIANALRHTEMGGVYVRLAEVDGRLEIRVRDTGPGIPPELQPELFEPFRRGDRGGTGLGLAISRQLATVLQGRLLLQASGPGGSTFLVDLPFTPPEACCDERRIGPSTPSTPAPLDLDAPLGHRLLSAAERGDIGALEALLAEVREPTSRARLADMVGRYDLAALVTALRGDTYGETEGP